MPGGCAYYSNPATLRLVPSTTSGISNITYQNTNTCSATLTAISPCSDRVGWQLYKVRYLNYYYDVYSTFYWTNVYSVSANISSDYTLYYRPIFISSNTTTLGISYLLTQNNSLKPIINTSSSFTNNGLCSETTTLSATSSANNYQWKFPNNTTTFDTLAGTNVPTSVGGTNQNLTFNAGDWTQYSKTPWQVQSTNACGTATANITIKNWCEICTTIPSTLCSNNARLASDELLAPNTPTTKTLLYPNPTDRIINIQSDEIIQKICLYDMLGTELQSLTTNDKTYQLDMQNISQGFYFVKIFTQNQKSETFKVQIMK